MLLHRGENGSRGTRNKHAKGVSPTKTHPFDVRDYSYGELLVRARRSALDPDQDGGDVVHPAGLVGLLDERLGGLPQVRGGLDDR